jgi:hypothetical protein
MVGAFTLVELMQERSFDETGSKRESKKSQRNLLYNNPFSQDLVHSTKPTLIPSEGHAL